MKVHLCLTLCLLLTTVALAQPPDTLWTRTYGGLYNDEARALALTADDGFVVVGSGDFNVLRADAAGNVLWTQNLWGDFQDVAVTPDGGFMLCGQTWNEGQGSDPSAALLVRLNADGDTLWTRRYGDTLSNDVANAVVTTADGGFAFTGMCEVMPMWFGAFTVKTDANGDTLWTSRVGGNFYNVVGNDLVTTPEGGLIVGGQHDGNMSLLWYDQTGGITQQYSFHDDNTHWGANSIAVRANGNVLAAGWQYNLPAGDYDMLEEEVTPSMEHVWGYLYHSGLDERALAVATWGDDGVLIAGYTEWGGNGSEILVSANSTTTFYHWSRSIGGSGDEMVSDMAMLPTSEILLAGYTTSYGAGGKDWYVIKLSAWLNATPRPAPVPSELTLSAYPNPFNSTATITYAVPQSGEVTLRIFTIEGREVATLVNEPQTAGTHTVKWEAADMPSGIYLYQVTAGRQSLTNRIALLK